MEYYSPRKMKFPSKWVVLESLILREITQSEKDKKKKKKACTLTYRCYQALYVEVQVPKSKKLVRVHATVDENVM